jgi:GMP synthase-like glutamine amidotransferase
MRVDVLQHVPFEGPAAIAPILEYGGHLLSVTHLYAGDAPPGAAETEALVVMGGPMSVHDSDRYPWLSDELVLIGECIERGIPVLGICLGAQLIAASQGARVYRGDEKEIGWFPVYMTKDAKRSRLTADWPSEQLVLHWHGDTFDLPAGARLLATSSAYRHQAFQLNGTVLGLQFHIEMANGDVRDIVQNSRHELLPGRFVQSEEEILRGGERPEVLHAMLKRMLERWIASKGGSDE